MSTSRKRLNRAKIILKKYKNALNLQHFDITLKLLKKDAESGAAGECRINLKYRWAEISLYPSAFRKPNNLEHIIVHEICHIIIEPLYVFCFDLMNCRFRSGNEIEEQREIAVETITRLALRRVGSESTS